MTSLKAWPAAIAVGAMFAASPSIAQQAGQTGGFYAAVSGGTATYFDQDNLEYDFLGFVIAGQIGYRIMPDIRLEGELAYQSASAEIDGTSIDVDVTNFRPSIAAYYDFNTISLGGLTPYAGAGLGISFLEADVDGGGDDDDEELSLHLEGGGSLSLGNNLDIVPAARWELTDDASNFQLRVGARFGF